MKNGVDALIAKKCVLWEVELGVLMVKGYLLSWLFFGMKKLQF